MYQLTNSPDILKRLSDGASVTRGTWLWPQEWLDAGNVPEPMPVHVPTREEQIAAAASAIQKRLDDVAISWQYNSIESAATYAYDPDPQFAAEGTALALWRSQTWAAVRQHQNSVQTLDELLALLPEAPSRPMILQSN